MCPPPRFGELTVPLACRSEQEERQDQANYSQRAQNAWKKQQIFKSLAAAYVGEGIWGGGGGTRGYTAPPHPHPTLPRPEDPQPVPSAKRKLGKKGRDKRKRSEEPEASAPHPAAAPPHAGGTRRRGSAPLGPAVRLGGRDFTGKRLEAFGLNPRRLRYRQLLRQRRKKGGGRGGKEGKPPRPRSGAGGEQDIHAQ